MLDLLPDWPAMSVFLVAALLVGISPGPGMLYAVARGVSQGTRGAVVAVLGLSAGSFINCLVAATGLAAVISASAIAYDIVRYLGAVYLVYLAVRTLRAAPPDHLQVDRLPNQDSASRIFSQALITNVINPKSALFYLSFVPQFLDPARGSLFWQFIVLGLFFNFGGNTINLCVALLFGRMGDRLLSSHPDAWRAQRWFTASILGGLAAYLAASTR